MSEADRQKWNEKHARAGLPEPEPFVLRALDALEARGTRPGRALDVASGTGRHALELARRGWDVLAVDVSSVGLALLEERAAARGLRVQARALDLDEGLPAGGFDLVLMSHFMDHGLWPALREAVAPGGALLVQAFTQEHAARTGFRRDYCLEDGELLRELDGWEIVLHEAGEDAGRYLEGALALKR